jgi:hypothetical protein
MSELVAPGTIQALHRCRLRTTCGDLPAFQEVFRIGQWVGEGLFGDEAGAPGDATVRTELVGFAVDGARVRADLECTTTTPMLTSLLQVETATAAATIDQLSAEVGPETTVLYENTGAQSRRLGVIDTQFLRDRLAFSVWLDIEGALPDEITLELGNDTAAILLGGHPAEFEHVRIAFDPHSPFAARDLGGLAATPPVTTLHSASPNPFNPSTWIAFELARPGTASLKIYDTAGRLIRTLFDGFRGAGEGAVRWDGRDLNGRAVASGVYHAQLRAEGRAWTERLVLVR